MNAACEIWHGLVIYLARHIESSPPPTRQIALNSRREEELAKLKTDLDAANINHESTLAVLRQKHNASIADMGEQIDNLNKQKAK